MSSRKMWGNEPFWGLGFEWDPQWMLTERQKTLQAKLIELCQTELRANAIESDRNRAYPRKNFQILAEHGFLGLIVPKELGGQGENHICVAMVVETIARYGCASTAMCYTMHTGAVAAALLRHHDNAALKDILRRLDKDCLIGTLSYSDPETGSHFWYPISSGVEETKEGWHVRKKASWTTSGGFADWYIVQTTSPNFNGNYADLSCFLILGDEITNDPGSWNGLGLRGNQSGPLEVNKVVPRNRLVGPIGDGARSNDEVVDPFFLLCSSACWSGIAMGMIDIAKAHTTKKTHKDVGMRVADYATIQDYVGEAIIDTNVVRSMDFLIAKALDDATRNNDWSVHKNDVSFLPRAGLLHWLWQLKFAAAKNVAAVSDKMLHACGGTGYKPELQIERYLRDAKAGWVMGPTNEVLRQFVGKTSLLGFEAVDYWNTSINERVLNNEIKKMDVDAKRALAERLLAEINPPAIRKTA
ncbi:acyl-CoA dehydrogenase [Labrys sp. KNU-23]|uniref:acyl-CoA dehydrogenase family protein n=1 Tax=Labrys sp. KNU-23 TaxID=2789216 RepID=UPI0011EF3065|nr:acyl-CoA dehydrogenase family protein [Labrys sp. KNU-23]QEN89589.1 acyl-CoA dehydrogenase [Labrys sp. KNU-23]